MDVIFNSIKEINRLRKEINRSLNNECQIFILKLLFRLSENFDFLDLKNLSPGQFLGSSNSGRYH